MVYPVRNKIKEAPDGCLRQPVSNGVYLLIGQDITAKTAFFKQLKEKFLPPELQDFNFDILYAQKIKLQEIQERFLALPLNNAKRLILIKDAQLLDAVAQDFILAFVQKPQTQLILALDFQNYDYKQGLIKGLAGKAEIIRFQETINPDTFTLSRQIDAKKTDQALRILNQLLRNGEPAERILGGLRYAWEKQNIQSLGAKGKLALLLTCDLEIKTSRLKPACALEKLVVSLCAFA